MQAGEPVTADPDMPGKAGLIGLLLCSLFPVFGLFAIGVDLPRIAAAFADQPNARLLAQLIGGSTGLAFALSSPVIGLLIERFGYRNVYVASIVGFAIIGATPALLDSLPLIVATRCLLGITVAGAMTAGMSGLGQLPAAVRGRMFGRNAVVSSVGAIISFPLVGKLAALSWRTPFLIHLAALLIIPLVMSLRSKPSPRGATARSAGGKGLGVPIHLVALAALIGLTMYVGPMFSPFYLASIGITDPALAAIPLSTMSCCSLLMTSNYGRLHARFGTATIFGGILLAVGIGLTSAGMSLSLPIFAASMGVVACGLAMFTPNMGAAISEVSAGNPGRGIGWAMSAMFAVQVFFPFIAEGIRS
ncbi:MAG: transporter, partial [Rhizorhabdus sp.]|nr:transporter [Rhizorhabdus sp.]